MTRLLLLLFLIISSATLAQKITFRGIVVDSLTNKGIAYASVGIYKNNALIEATSADQSGKFVLTSSQGSTHIQASFIGYNTATLSTSGIISLGEIIIKMSVGISLLDKVIIAGKRPVSRLQVDRKIIDLGADIQQSGVNALEAFQQLPEIQVDMASGSISLRGNDNVSIRVNGKISSLTPTELLKQIKASSIDRIEVMTSPSSRYGGDGLSGIINIILKREDKKGLNVGVHSTLGTKRYSFGGNGSFNSPLVKVRVHASRSGSKAIDYQHISRLFRDGSTESIFTPYVFDGGITNLSTGVDFFLKDRHEFSLGIDYTDDAHGYRNKSAYTKVTQRSDYEYLREVDHFHGTTIFDSNYRLKFKKENHFFEVDYQLNLNGNSYPISDFRDGNLLFDQDLSENFKLQSLALDYSFPLKRNINVETGVSRNTQVLASRQITVPAGGSAVSNHFDYRESLLAGYILSKFFIRKLKFQMGLRYEYFKSDSKIYATHLEKKNVFANLFPSIQLSYVINDKHTLNMAYSRRISRPDFHQLNAYQLVSPLFTWEYNPDITPELSQNIEMSFQKNTGGLHVSCIVFFRQRADAVLWVEFSRNNTQVFRYQNAGTFHSYGIEKTIRYNIAPFWNAQLNANYYYTKINQRSLVTWNRMVSSTFQFKHTFTIRKIVITDFTYTHNIRRQNTFNVVDPRSRFDWATAVELFRKRLAVSLRVIDLFDQNVLRQYSRSANLRQNTQWEFQSEMRNYLLGMSYKIVNSSQKTRTKKVRTYNKTPID